VVAVCLRSALEREAVNESADLARHDSQYAAKKRADRFGSGPLNCATVASGRVGSGGAPFADGSQNTNVNLRAALPSRTMLAYSVRPVAKTTPRPLQPRSWAIGYPNRDRPANTR
jgi:hypothetical protein